jgi:hypothetical protein
MKKHSALNWLVPIIGVLGLAAAGAGIFWQPGYSPSSFTTLYGETVQIAGGSLYAHDTLFTAAALRGTDIVTLIVGIPLLIISFWLYRDGSLRGGLLLAGTLAYFLYYGASLGLATAYNSLFLVYLGLFSASFFSFVLVLTAFDLQALPGHISTRLPRRGIAVFMFVAGLGTGFIWLSDAVSALLGNTPPTALGPYTTLVTYLLDVGIIMPSAILAGILLLRRAGLGYLLSAVLTIMLALVGAMVIVSTVMQLSAGIQFSTGELVGKVGSWIILGLFAIGFTVSFLRNAGDNELKTDS